MFYVIDFDIAPCPLEQFLICNETPNHWIRSVFSACLKQSDVLVLVTRVAIGNWFHAEGWPRQMLYHRQNATEIKCKICIQ